MIAEIPHAQGGDLVRETPQGDTGLVRETPQGNTGLGLEAKGAVGGLGLAPRLALLKGLPWPRLLTPGVIRLLTDSFADSIKRLAEIMS